MLFSLSGITPTLANTTTVELPTSPYETARQELSTEFYVLYRIVERIARANAYDQNTWRVEITSEYDANAFARDINLIAINHRVLEQVAGDSSALACIVAHEMGHQVKRHIPITPAQKNEYIAQIRTEVERELSGQKRPNTTWTGSAVRIVGSAIANRFLPGLVGDLVGGIISNRDRNRRANSQQQVEQIIAQKTQELEDHLKERQRLQELEADEVAYVASVSAGFEPAGCIRGIQVLAKFTDPTSPTHQQSFSQRLEAMTARMEKHPVPTLVETGGMRITRSQPLTYNFVRDPKLLRINPRYGGSAVQDIDRLFGGK